MKVYKKLALTTILTASLISPTFAATENTNTKNSEIQNISEESVKGELENLKKIFNISNDYEYFNISRTSLDERFENKFLQDLTKKKYITNYEWSDDKLGNIYVSINSDGDLVSYSKNTVNEDNKNNKINLSKNDAEEEIKKVLNQAINNFDKNYVLKDYSIDRYTGEHNFSYMRTMNGIPFVDQNIVVTYSPVHKEINSINIASNFGEFVSFIKDSHFKKEDKIGMKKSKEILQKESPLKLSYLIKNDKSERVYYTQVPNINARTGEISDNDFYSGYGYAKDAAESSNADGSLSKVEKEKLKGIKNLAPQSEAKKIAKEIIGDGYKVKNISTYSHDKIYTYEITLLKGEIQADVILNAKTLELLSVSNYENSKNNQKLKEDELKKMAIEITRDYANTNDLNFKKMKVTYHKEYADILIPRYVYTRPVIGDGVKIQINYDKNLNSFSRDYSAVEFNKEKLKLTPEEATEIYFNSKDFGLKYQMTNEGPKLFYGSINSINPQIGEDKVLRDINGNIVNFKEQINYSDLNNARNKDAINYMTNAGLGIVNKNLADKVTYGEFIDLLEGYDVEPLNAIGLNYDIKNLEKIKDKNIIEKDAVKAIVYYDNLEKFIQAKKIFKEDIFENQKNLKEYENYYIIAKGFELIGDEIKPDEELSLEEILYLIYRAL